MFNQIQSDTVGPSDVVGYDDGSVRAVHARPFDPGRVTPVAPVEPAVQRIDRDRPRFVDARRDEDLPVRTVEIRHFY